MSRTSDFGAIYLLYMGIQLIRDQSQLTVDASGERFSYGRIVGSSTLVNLTNPKILVFYLTFLPQFTSPGGGNVGWQMAILGVIFVLMGFATDATIGVISGRIFQRVQQDNTRLFGRVRIFSGAVLCALAGVMAFMTV